MDELDKILQLLEKRRSTRVRTIVPIFINHWYFYAMNFSCNNQEAEDAVQEVFIKFGRESVFTL